MKKTYFAPETEITEFLTEEMIAASTDVIIGEEWAEGNPVLDKQPSNASIWGDDED